MFGRFGQFLKTRRYGVRTVTAVAVGFLFAGFVVASGLNWTATSAAQGPAAVNQPAAEPPVLGGSLAPLAARLTPSVVNVKVTKIEKAQFRMPQMPQGQEDPFGQFFERFFNDGRGMPRDQRVQAAGSGVIISRDGYILTNNHVVDGAKEVTVTLADQSEHKAQIVGTDPKTDLAVLKIKSDDLPAATLGDSDHLQVGDWVLAIGNPFGLSHTVTSGIVSAKGRVIGAGPYDDFIQTDASINPGNSGGPLFNMKGEVVGINTAIVPNGQGIGFAIPIDTAKPLIPQLVKNGEVTRGYLGVNIQSITPDLAKAMSLKEHGGALVAGVMAGGPAEKAGIEQGDVIIAFNGKTVKDSHDLPTMVAAAPVGKTASVTVLRDGKQKELDVEIAKLKGDTTKNEETGQHSQGKWGLMLQNLTPDVASELGLKDNQGVLVAGVKPGSPADEASLRRGDVILEVNRQPVTSVDQLKAKIAAAGDKDTLLLLVKRDQASLFIALKG